MKLLKSLALSAIMMFSISVSAAPVVVVNPANDIPLDVDAVKNIYLGKKKSMTPVIVGVEDAAYVSFTKSVLGKSPSQLASYWAQRIFTGKGHPPAEKGSAQSALSFVASNHDGIAILDDSQIDDSVRVALKL